jgi:hypothetical protein
MGKLITAWERISTDRRNARQQQVKISRMGDQKNEKESDKRGWWRFGRKKRGAGTWKV